MNLQIQQTSCSNVCLSTVFLIFPLCKHMYIIIIYTMCNHTKHVACFPPLSRFVYPQVLRWLTHPKRQHLRPAKPHWPNAAARGAATQRGTLCGDGDLSQGRGRPFAACLAPGWQLYGDGSKPIFTIFSINQLF